MSEWSNYEKLVMHELKELKQVQAEIFRSLTKHVETEDEILAKIKLDIASTKFKINIIWGMLVFFLAPIASWAINKLLLKGG